jgi:hypothetical protein
MAVLAVLLVLHTFGALSLRGLRRWQRQRLLAAASALEIRLPSSPSTSASPNPNDIEFDNLYLDNVIEGRAMGTKVFTVVIAAIVEQEEVGIDFHVSLTVRGLFLTPVVPLLLS